MKGDFAIVGSGECHADDHRHHGDDKPEKPANEAHVFCPF
jgi:hypothetical protein